MSPEIAIDARWLHTGLGTYTYNLLGGLRRVRNDLALRAIVHENNADQIAPLCQSVRILDTPIYTIREQLQVFWAARGADLLHVPHYNVSLLYRGRLVVTIHDLTHIMDEEHNRIAVRAYARVMMNAAARKADQLITVSEFSKSQIVERLGIEPSKITVIPNGVAPQFRPLGQQQDFSVGIRTPQREGYFLYVGNLKPHKNLGRFLSAVALFHVRTKSDWKFLIIGPGEANELKQLREHSVRTGISEFVSFRTDVSDEALPSVYREAKFSVVPSTFEGFGLPVLEAMACGTPVLCSRAASIPEVGGDAVHYFNPMDIEDMAAALEAAANSPDLRVSLREKGLRRAARFSWDESARLHAEVYERVMQNYRSRPEARSRAF